MKLKRANKHHLSQINDLCQVANWAKLEPCFLNDSDIAIVAMDKKKVIGFVWVGIMAKGRYGYIDWFAIHPDYQGKKLGEALLRKMMEIAQKKGCVMIFGTIPHNESHDASLANTAKVGMQRVPMEFSVSIGNPQLFNKE